MSVWFPAPTASGPLYELRRARGLSRRELAELSGVALATISRIERSVGGPPNRSTLLALGLALDVSTELLSRTSIDPHNGQPVAVAATATGDQDGQSLQRAGDPRRYERRHMVRGVAEELPT